MVIKELRAEIQGMTVTNDDYSSAGRELCQRALMIELQWWRVHVQTINSNMELFKINLCCICVVTVLCVLLVLHFMLRLCYISIYFYCVCVALPLVFLVIVLHYVLRLCCIWVAVMLFASLVLRFLLCFCCIFFMLRSCCLYCIISCCCNCVVFCVAFVLRGCVCNVTPMLDLCCRSGLFLLVVFCGCITSVLFVLQISSVCVTLASSLRGVHLVFVLRF